MNKGVLMRILIDKKDFENALDLTANVVSKKSINAILQNILIIAKENELHLIATDIEVSLILRLQADVQEEGSVCVMNSLLRDIVKAANAESIELSTESTGIVNVKAIGTGYEATVHSMSPDDFPKVETDELDNAPAFFIKGFLLKEMLSKNIPFAAKDDVRYTFNSVYFEKNQLEFKTVSSDTKRLALVKTFVDTKSSDFSLLIPIKTAKILKDMLLESDLEIKIMNKKAGFVHENMTLISNQIEGNFPDYKSVIPKETNYNISLSKPDFEKTIKSLSPFLIGDIQKVTLKFEAGTLFAFTEQSELGQGKNTQAISYDQEEISISFNYKFLLDIINVIEDEEFLLKIWQSDKPAIFSGKDSDQALFVTVPMKQ